MLQKFKVEIIFFLYKKGIEEEERYREQKVSLYIKIKKRIIHQEDRKNLKICRVLCLHNIKTYKDSRRNGRFKIS